MFAYDFHLELRFNWGLESCWLRGAARVSVFMGSGIETLVIHLARAEGRRAQVEKLLQGTPYPARVLAAVDGAIVPVVERNTGISNRPLFAPSYPFPIGSGEYGCFQSHRKAWQTILDEGLEAALILEDDVELTPVFSDSLAFAVEQSKTYGYVQFQTRRVDKSSVVSRLGRSCLVQPQVTPLRTSAQVVSRSAAEKLLILSEVIDRPVDAFLQSHWHTGLHVTCIVPSGIEDRTQETGGSTISLKRSIWAKMKHELKREFLRGRYRIAVKRLSKSANSVH